MFYKRRKVISAKIAYLILISILTLIICRDSIAQQSYNLDIAYNYLNNGQVKDAIDIFEPYAKENPTNTYIYLQLGYAYLDVKDNDKAYYYFDYVINKSTEYDEIEKAKKQIFYLEAKKKKETKIIQPVDTTTITTNENTPIDDLNLAYKYLSEKKIDLAIPLFESYIKANPKDTKVYMQLGYIYSDRNEYRKALDKFDYVSFTSRDNEEIDKANESIFILKEMIPIASKVSCDLYFFNVYDSYQQNYISNFISHFNFKFTKFFYTGFYVDSYLDSRSKPELIYNDRYFEIGSFWKFLFLRYLSFELRTGYVREIDLKKNGFNVKPILTFGMRVGNPKFYSGFTNRQKEFVFMDLYSAVLYDYKFKNIFAQVSLRETMRFLTGGYSFLEVYAFQNALGDTKQLDYNNYGEVGVGLGWKPSMIGFPTIFVEASNKFYWRGVTMKNSFQIKAGFLLNFNTAL